VAPALIDQRAIRPGSPTAMGRSLASGGAIIFSSSLRRQASVGSSSRLSNAFASTCSAWYESPSMTMANAIFVPGCRGSRDAASTTGQDITIASIYPGMGSQETTMEEWERSTSRIRPVAG
jgi:hypothetical protein